VLSQLGFAEICTAGASPKAAPLHQNNIIKQRENVKRILKAFVYRV
jgi:hypothetical protein